MPSPIAAIPPTMAESSSVPELGLGPADSRPIPLSHSKSWQRAALSPSPASRDVDKVGLSGGFRHQPLELDTETNLWGGLGSAYTCKGVTVREIRNVFQVYPDDLEITQG